jgi:hypothetical protein
MAKKVTGSVKLQIAAGKATPAPPVGPALGQAQVNIMEFCKQFNARTSQKELEGLIVPVVIDSAEACRGHCQGLGSAEQRQGRQSHAEADRGHRETEDAGPECGFGGRGH